MRKTMIGAACGAAMGVLLTHMGYTVLTWQFWAGIGLMLAYALNVARD